MRNSLIIMLCLLFTQSPIWAQQELLDGFSHEWLDLDFENPAGIAFDDFNRMLVWEKQGKVWYVIDEEKQETPLLDISEEVGNYGDMGLLGFTLDPNFKENGYIYAFYVVDYYHLMFYGAADYNPDYDLYWRATVTRCTRYTVNDIESNPAVDYSSRKVLLGEGPGLGPSAMFTVHIGCGIDFGDDGTLLLTTGDGTGWEGPYYGDGPPYLGNYVEQGLQDGVISPEEEVGALRAQQLGSLNGKVLRIDPETGEGVSSNPYYDPENPNSNESKIWALGFRNPFQIKVRPGSGFTDPSLGLPGVAYLGDVGDGLWEELNIIRKGGLNYGWPIYEGCEENVNYPFEKINQFAPNPLYGTDGCDTEFFKFDDLLKQESKNEVLFKNPCDENVDIPEKYTFQHTRPDLNLAHITVGNGVYFGGFDEDGNAANLSINSINSTIEGDFSDLESQCVIGGDFYCGGTFPDEFKDVYFFADYNHGWINYLEYDLNDSIIAMKTFYKDTFPKVGLTVNPGDGCLYVNNYEYGLSRICYGDNLSPKAVIKNDISFGDSPLTVNFDASESFDPQGENITVRWDFEDGSSSTNLLASHTFTSDNGRPTSFEVSLTVEDEIGQTHSQTKLISVNNTPPEVDITSISNGDLYNMTGISEIDLSANVVDQEHAQDELKYNWILSLHHNTHDHPEPAIHDVEAVVKLIPAGCSEEVFYYGIELMVEDEEGLRGSDEVFLYPDCGNDYLELLTFQAQLLDDVVVCNWLTIQEENVSHYEIEHAIGQGSFQKVGTVPSINNFDEQSYTFNHEEPFPGLNFYRLKMVSEDGIETYSDERLVFYAQEDEIFVYPNPVTDFMSIFYGKLNDIAVVELYNIEGRLFRRFEIEGIGSQIQKLDLSGIHPGNYIYRIKNGDLLKTGQFTIIR